MAIHTDAIAKVYAKSLYELADDAGGRDKIVELAEELEQICELARGDRTFREFLASPIINTKARGEAIRRIFHGRVTDLALRFLLVLNNKVRLRRLESIKRRIRAALGKDPVLYSYTDAAMIGGVRLRIGDQLIDGSVASRLRRLRQHLLTSGSSAVRQRLDRIIEEGAEG